jgi:hypothetical protein
MILLSTKLSHRPCSCEWKRHLRFGGEKIFDISSNTLVLYTLKDHVNRFPAERVPLASLSLN